MLSSFVYSQSAELMNDTDGPYTDSLFSPIGADDVDVMLTEAKPQIKFVSISVYLYLVSPPSPF